MYKLIIKHKLLLLAAFSFLAGCHLYRAHLPYNNECKEWVGEVNADKYMGMDPGQAMRAMPDPQERYRYFICINSFMHPTTQSPDIFLPDAEQSVKILASNLVGTENTEEILLIIWVLCYIHTKGEYDVVADKRIMNAIMESKKKIPDPRHQKAFDERIAWMQERRGVRGQ